MTNNNLLYESLGLPKVVYDLTELIYKQFLNYNEDLILQTSDRKVYVIKLNKKDYENSFFNELKLSVEITNNDISDDSRYIPEINGWNDIEKIFNVVKIRIIVNIENKNNIKELIAHELLHAYDDYKTKLNTNIGFIDGNSNYFTINTPELNQIFNKFGDDRKLHFLAYYVYYLLEPEKRANVTQLYFELQKHKFTKEDITSEKYKTLTFYKNYLNINENAENIVNYLNENELSLFKEFIKNSYLVSLYSKSDDVFKRRIIKYFKEKSETTMRKMQKIMMQYLNDGFLMEYDKFQPSRKKFEELTNHFKIIHEKYLIYESLSQYEINEPSRKRMIELIDFLEEKRKNNK